MTPGMEARRVSLDRSGIVWPMGACTDVVALGGTYCMSCYRIAGGVPLDGTVSVSGSKNGSLPLLAAALLVDGEVVLHNIPDIRDIRTMIGMLRTLGARAAYRDDGALVIDSSTVNAVSAPYDLVRRMRGSFYVAGPLLTRFGEAQVPLPGGCVIGSRPVDLHV